MCIIYFDLCRCCRTDLHTKTKSNIYCHIKKRTEEKHELVIKNEQKTFCADCKFEMKWYMETVGFKKIEDYHRYSVAVKAHKDIEKGKNGVKVYYTDCGTQFFEGNLCDYSLD